MKQRILAGIVLVIGLTSAREPLVAQAQRSGGGETQKLMQQYQQVAAEKTALQAQLAQMKKDLDAASTELAAVKKERDSAKAHVGVSPATLAQATSEKDAAQQNLEKTKRQLTELVARFRETATNLRDAETDRAKLTISLADRNSAFDKCAANNLQLYEIVGDVLNRYEHVGVFTKVSASEPFTKITRTRIENLVDEYRERALQLRQKAPAH
jgi:chaperonin cofactor prefoldin